MIIVQFLRWFFVPHGIVVVEEEGMLSWFEAIKRLLSGGVKRSMNGPSAGDFQRWIAFHRPLKRYRCSICHVAFWSWRKPRRGVCYKWSCYRGSELKENIEKCV